jgi:transposase
VDRISLLGVDLAKDVFQLHGMGRKGERLLSKRVKRRQLLEAVKKVPKCLVVMEACGSAHY